MMNLLSFCLLLTSLAAAGVWSPSPERQKQRQGDGQDVIVKEGHRTIVVEYEQDGQPNTIVSISPEQHHIRKPDSIASAEGGISSAASGMVENVKENIKEASSFLPNLGQGLSQSSENGEIRESYVTHKELICDALGKCKHKIASAMGKAKEMVSKTAHEAIDKTKEVAHEAKEEAKEKAREVGEAAGHTLGKSKETVPRKAREVEERVKECVKDAKDITKTIGEDIARNVSDRVEMAKEDVVEKAKEAKQTAEHAADKLKTDQSKKKLSWKFERGREVGRDAAKYVKSPETMSCLMCVINLLGLATAYGMCVWVTFISSYILAGVLPRQQFGIVQSKIYPVYFSTMAVSIGASLMGLLLGNTKSLFSSKAERFQGYYLLASLLMVFFNMLFLEPRATKIMFERIKMEKEEGRERGTDSEQEIIRIRIVRLNDKLKKLNTYSSFLNILTLMALSWHLVYLGQRPQYLTC
ncbi:uncharacterized protein LOC121259909 [Juglans microcarpa x Juglans regia]|uniref:uncharacterized protein LOC121259909 n=1 Tax=Juglans microcarpa x Juglans regia TaxID=2249226 RepID=UPI001B7EFF4C|nr:uncharacterized protein LOC121259909 [Juglans microcarpa x Juglans regia]